MNNSIKPGQVWLDTEGKRVQAHGGSGMEKTKKILLDRIRHGIGE